MFDALAALFLIIGVAGFGLGAHALGRASDVEAIYWLVVGIVGVRAAVAVARPAGGT
jgi:hypothetical protein